VQRAAGFGLVAQLGLIALATLLPFRFALPARVALDFELRAPDLALNFAMLLPLGFLAALRFGFGARRTLMLGALLSAALETLQLLVPMRCPSLYDVAMNALGAGFGAALYTCTARRSTRFIEQLISAPPSFERGAFITLALLVAALGVLHRDGMGFRWTLGLAPLVGDARSIVLGSIASLSLAAWLGYTLRPGAPAWLAVAWAAPIAVGLELCRGFSASHDASFASLLLAVIVALGAARARHTVEGWRLALR
jgi:hypothetical protein